MVDEAIRTEYISTGANRHTAVADWSSAGVLAFGANNNIALWQPKESPQKGIAALLTGHKDAVKAVKFLPCRSGDQSLFLLTGADDHALKLWLVDRSLERYECVQTVQEHTAAVNCIAALESRTRSGGVLLASGAADATIKIWTFESGQISLLQSIKTQPKYLPLSLALSPLGRDEDGYILAAVGTRDIIQIFTNNTSDSGLDFNLQTSLSGHEGWIMALDFVAESNKVGSDLLLASASQDKYIRLWRVHEGNELPALGAAGSDPLSGAYLPGKSPSNKAYRIKCSDKSFSVTFEALLLGHEDWIYSARWHRQQGRKLQLLSASADNSLALWEADPHSGIWISTVRLGEISREKGATTATGSTGGFWTGLWSPDGLSVVCLGRTGSWRRWDYDEIRDEWQPNIAITGHTKSVTGIAWSKDGAYLLSTSSDQTTRLHATWHGVGQNTWHEISRPQIHGYDLNCIDSLGTTQFVSGADEKLLRVFSEPRAVAKLLHELNGIGQADIENMPDAANIPVLGLSNKAIDTQDDVQRIVETNGGALYPGSAALTSSLDVSRPPFEDSLSRHTLWPEVEKLYGHGYEISCLAVSHDGQLIASACRASSTNHAVIRLFETKRWTEVKPPLTIHSLTATRLRFSPDDKCLLSVGRDRQWAVFGRTESDRERYALLQSNPKGHSRMILDAAWSASTSRRAFATAGRDKQVKVWVSKEVDGGQTAFSLATTIPLGQPVTAVDFLAARNWTGNEILAAGTEEGKISIYTLALDDNPRLVSNVALSPDLYSSKSINQLAWHPGATDETEDGHVLAIAAEDSSLRISRVRI